MSRRRSPPTPDPLATRTGAYLDAHTDGQIEGWISAARRVAALHGPVAAHDVLTEAARRWPQRREIGYALAHLMDATLAIVERLTRPEPEPDPAATDGGDPKGSADDGTS